MRTRRLALRAFAAVLGVFAAVAAARGATLVVTNTNDGGAGSFRQAILDSNATPGSDLIQFGIPGPGPHTIVTFAPIAVTGSVLIDGYSQPGSVWNSTFEGTNAVLQVVLLGQGTDGLVITGGSSIVQGLALYGFQTAIAISGLPGVTVQGCFLGTDAAGDPNGVGNVTGVSITGTAGLDRIGDNYPAARNLISGNSSAGVLLSGTSGKVVRGNIIGTDASGWAALPNGTGVRLVNTGGNLVGGPDNADRNVISANSLDAVEIDSGVDDRVEGNWIGSSVGGNDRLGNGRGVFVHGTSPAFEIHNNNIVFNLGDGVTLAFDAPPSDSTLARVTDNRIGGSAPDPSVVGNGGAGIRIEEGDGIEIIDNWIYNNRVGVWRLNTADFRTVIIRRNSFEENRGLGIVVGPAETISANQPSGFLNFPLITWVTPNGTDTIVDGVYRGRPDSEVTIDIYQTWLCPASRPRHFTEGQYQIATEVVTTDASGFASFQAVVPNFPLSVRGITATATLKSTPDPFEPPFYETSPFSQRLPYTMTPASGPAGGGTPVALTGSDFDFGAAVGIGGQAAPNVAVADTEHLSAQTPALAAGAAYDVTVINPDGTRGTLSRGWVADFLDVAPANPFHEFVVALAAQGVAGGIGGGLYGVGNPVLRQQMAVFLLKARHGVCFVPQTCMNRFADVVCPSPFADWIEALRNEGITSGCAPGMFCPTDVVLRQQMAVFLLKAKHAYGYQPPGCAGTFADVPCASPFAPWIEQLVAENITAGCGGGNFCPTNPTTRGQMAVFLTKAFQLQ